MTNRIYTAFVFLAWLASMSWLFAAKIWPTLYGGDPPDYTASVSTASASSPAAVWRISWKERRIGMAASRVVPRTEGTALRYVVQFERLPLELMLTETFGVVASLFFRDRDPDPGPGGEPRRGQPGRHGGDYSSNDRAWELDLLLATELRFDANRKFTGFRTVGELPNLAGQLQIEGHVDERQKLVLKTQIPTPFGGSSKPLRQEIDLPPNAIVHDAFAPRSELKNLHVGQKWTIPVYRPFPPNSPVQIIAAQAERHELLLWDGHDVEAIVVVYHDDAGSGLNSAREPIAREWVREDGLVIQQEMQWSGSVIRFERIPAFARESLEELLSDDANPRLWSVSNRSTDSQLPEPRKRDASAMNAGNS